MHILGYILVVNSLLKVLNRMGIKALGYTDDIAILARGAFDEVLRDFVQEALRVREAWFKDKALRIQGDKTSAIIFSRRYTIKSLRRMVIYTAYEVTQISKSISR